MKNLLNLLFFLITCSLSAQTITGVVYDSISAIENIKIKNLANNALTSSDENGYFSIRGKLNDTLKISSLFYHDQKVVLKEIHLSESLVIELKKVINTLEEVELIDKYKEELRDIEVAEVAIKNQLANDMKNNPHLYKPDGLNPNMDFIAIFGLVAKLFKKKDKFIEVPFSALTFEDLETLFNSSRLFNDDFLFNTLKIKKDNKFLFFEYIAAQNLDRTLLEKTKEIVLIEAIINASKAFNTILEDFKKEQLNKN